MKDIWAFFTEDAATRSTFFLALSFSEREKTDNFTEAAGENHPSLLIHDSSW